MCTPYLVSIISTYSIAIFLFKDWRETQCAQHRWRSYCTWAEQGLVHSSATQTANTLPLPLSSFPGAARGGEGNGSFLCDSPELPQPAPYHLSLTYWARTRLSGIRAHSLLSSGTALPVFMWAADIFCILFNLSFCVGLFLSTCGASVEWRGGEHLSSAGGALMGGSAGSGWDWGCWTGGGRACLSWDSSSSSRGSIRPPSTASSAACWDWPMCRASPLCPTASTRWHTRCLSFTYTHTRTHTH